MDGYSAYRLFKRGGSWSSSAVYHGVEHGYYYRPVLRDKDLGFRLVLIPVE